MDSEDTGNNPKKTGPTWKALEEKAMAPLHKRYGEGVEGVLKRYGRYFKDAYELLLQSGDYDLRVFKHGVPFLPEQEYRAMLDSVFYEEAIMQGTMKQVAWALTGYCGDNSRKERAAENLHHRLWLLQGGHREMKGKDFVRAVEALAKAVEEAETYKIFCFAAAAIKEAGSAKPGHPVLEKAAESLRGKLTCTRQDMPEYKSAIEAIARGTLEGINRKPIANPLAADEGRTVDNRAFAKRPAHDKPPKKKPGRLLKKHLRTKNPA